MSLVFNLFDSKWVSVNRKLLDNGGRYEYATEPWCDSLGVAVLVYRLTGNEWIPSQKEYLGRYEICPAHSEKAELCSITGGCDKEGEPFVETACREVVEETGYNVKLESMIQLGYVKPSKASDKTVHLFAVDVTDLQQGEAFGDGSLCEEGAYTEWVSRGQAIFCKDPLMTTMVTRLEALS